MMKNANQHSDKKATTRHCHADIKQTARRQKWNYDVETRWRLCDGRPLNDVRIVEEWRFCLIEADKDDDGGDDGNSNVDGDVDDDGYHYGDDICNEHGYEAFDDNSDAFCE